VYEFVCRRDPHTADHAHRQDRQALLELCQLAEDRYGSPNYYSISSNEADRRGTQKAPLRFAEIGARELFSILSAE
jgi:hypothetical protein